jgi:1,4-dihydroxy-2-naphthoate octaprenyltransferase
MGPVIVGLASFIQTGELTGAALWASAPVGCLVAAILLANNIRDVIADARGGRHTIPIVFGRSAGIGFFVALLVGAYASVVLAVVLRFLPATALLPMLTLTVPGRLVQLYRSTENPTALNAGVRGTAALHARFNLLLAVGIALGPLLARFLP